MFRIPYSPNTSIVCEAKPTEFATTLRALKLSAKRSQNRLMIRYAIAITVRNEKLTRHMIAASILLNQRVALRTLLRSLCNRRCGSLVLIPGLTSADAVIELLAGLIIMPFLLMVHANSISTSITAKDWAIDTGFVDLAPIASWC